MALNETTALLKNNYHGQQFLTDCYNNNHIARGYHAVDDKNHIVYINKDASEYEPIFCLNEYCSALTLDELLPYILDPWWQNLRRFLLITFWLIVLLIFGTACMLSYLRAGHNSCNILEKEITSNAVGMITSSSNSILAATTTFPNTIANVLSTELLRDK